MEKNNFFFSYTVLWFFTSFQRLHWFIASSNLTSSFIKKKKGVQDLVISEFSLGFHVVTVLHLLVSCPLTSTCIVGHTPRYTHFQQITVIDV